MHGFEEGITVFVFWLKSAAEVLGAVTIGTGLAVVMYHAVATWWLTHRRSFRWTRVQLSQYLVLALEFQLAADILATSIAPNWSDLGKLAVIATIRTALNFFLLRESEELETQTSRATDAA